MQLCSATVRLGGLLTSTVHLVGVTPAEIIVLQSIHGSDSVVDIIPTGAEPRSQHEEWDRLSQKYDRHNSFSTPDGDDGSVMSRLFPGAVKRLPVNLKEIGLGDLLPPEKSLEQAGVQLSPEAPAFVEGNADELPDDAVAQEQRAAADIHETEIEQALQAEAAPAGAEGAAATAG